MSHVESPSATQPFCVWTQGSRNFVVHIPVEVIANLGTESLVAFKRVPRRGLETGGILLGRTEFRDDTTTFWIEGFAPIESEHRFGPSYVFSDSDLAHLQAELTKNGSASLGIYRSQTRSERLAIEDADVALFEKCFGQADILFLMLAPVLRTGAFFFRADGDLTCVHQFPVVSSLSAVVAHGNNFPPHLKLHAPPRHSADREGALVIASPLVVATQSSGQIAPQDAVSITSPDTEITPSENPRAPRFGQQATALWSDRRGHSSIVKFTKLGARSRYPIGRYRGGAIRTPALGSPSPFRGARSPGIRLLYCSGWNGPVRVCGWRWDGNSSTVRGYGAHAVLHIQDGDQQSDRELASSEFTAGQFTYQPQHPEVTFRLNVYAGENRLQLVWFRVMFPQSPMGASATPSTSVKYSAERTASNKARRPCGGAQGCAAICRSKPRFNPLAAA